MTVQPTPDQHRFNFSMTVASTVRPPLVVLVEDDVDFAAMAQRYLERDGFRVVTAGDAAAGQRVVEEQRPDLVILDLGLPDGSGLELLTGLRAAGRVPVIILSGRADEPDRVVGLELGADDYVAKPCSLRELASRVRAVLRRAAGAVPSRGPTFAFDGLEVDTEAMEARAGCSPLDLTPLEFALLRFLAERPRRTYSRAQLLEAVWGSAEGWQSASTVSEHVYRLRRKLE